MMNKKRATVTKIEVKAMRQTQMKQMTRRLSLKQVLKPQKGSPLSPKGRKRTRRTRTNLAAAMTLITRAMRHSAISTE